MNFKIHNLAVLIEFLMAAGLGIFFHWVLEYKEASFVIFGVGVLLSLATWLLREHLEELQAALTEQYRHSHELTFSIAQISDPECQGKAQELVAGLGKTINMLKQGFIPLDETEFYLYGARASDKSEKTIRAIDPMTAGWASRGAMVNFYQANKRALQRGVDIQRIFVLNREELADPETQKVLKCQLQDGIDVRVAFRDELCSNGESTWASTCSFNFAIYDARVVTDVFSHSVTYYGKKTKEPAEVAKYFRTLALIEHNAHKVLCEQEVIILASEANKEVAEIVTGKTEVKKKRTAKTEGFLPDKIRSLSGKPLPA